MRDTFIFIILIQFAKIQEFDMTILSNKQLTLTLHEYDKSWNEAQSVCVALGGNLYVEDSAERGLILENYKSSWNSKVHVWVGLHYPAIATGDVFGWTSCEWQNTDIFNHWLPAEPKDPTSRKCGLSDKTGGNWITSSCDSPENFVCETVGTSDCSFSTAVGTPQITDAVKSVSLTTGDDVTCQGECLARKWNSTKNCWAVNYNTLGTDNCVLYFVDDPFYFDGITLTNDGSTFFIKQCYIRDIDTVDDTVVTVDTDTVPTQVCSSYTLQTTSSSTQAPTTPSLVISSTTPETTSSPTTSSSSTTSTIASPTTSTSTTASPTTSTTTSQKTASSTTSSETTSSSATSSPTSSSATTSQTTSTSTTSSTPSSTTTLSSSLSSTITTTTLASSSTLSVLSSSSTASVTNSTLSSTVSTLSPTCDCKCSEIAIFISNYTSSDFMNLTLEGKVEQLLMRLRIDTSKLSATIRRKTSAKDNRVSSKSIGFAGVAFLCIIFGLIIVSDGVNFIRYLSD